jgi:hypothetical protein
MRPPPRLDTGLVSARRFAGSKVISKKDVKKIRSLWAAAATSGAIGTAIGREKWLCANLQRMDLLTPHTTLGAGTRKVNLYSRSSSVLSNFRVCSGKGPRGNTVSEATRPH